jgi:hypothetical protein
MLGGLARSDQRAKGELYLRGLLLDGRRKSTQPMAERLGVDHQQLQQFVTSSIWDHVEVRKRLARWADGFIEPKAYVIDDSGFAKDGVDSPGVARMYSGTLGKVGNCQIGVSVHAVTDWASAAIDWQLFLPAGPPGKDPLAHRARLPRAQTRTGPGPLRRPRLPRLAPPRHPHRARPGLLHPTALRPKSPCAGLTLYAVLRELQTLLGVWTGACRTCLQPFPPPTTHPSGLDLTKH